MIFSHVLTHRFRTERAVTSAMGIAFLLLPPSQGHLSAMADNEVREAIELGLRGNPIPYEIRTESYSAAVVYTPLPHGLHECAESLLATTESRLG